MPGRGPGRPRLVAGRGAPEGALDGRPGMNPYTSAPVTTPRRRLDPWTASQTTMNVAFRRASSLGPSGQPRDQRPDAPAQCEPELLEATGVSAGERLVGEIAKRTAAPEAERLVEQLGGAFPARRERPPAFVGEPLELPRVDRVGLDAQLVTAAAADDHVGPECLAQVGDVNVERVDRRGGRIVAPEVVE